MYNKYQCGCFDHCVCLGLDFIQMCDRFCRMKWNKKYLNKLTRDVNEKLDSFFMMKHTNLLLGEKSVDNKFCVIGVSVYFVFHFTKLDFLRQLGFNGLISLIKMEFI